MKVGQNNSSRLSFLISPDSVHTALGDSLKKKSPSGDKWNTCETHFHQELDKSMTNASAKLLKMASFMFSASKITLTESVQTK